MEELRQLDVRDAHCIGITSGASTPESFMDAAIAYLRG
jgi:4-hydroxy-3-methylbut-2-enyl diphosphate reductase IspH